MAPGGASKTLNPQPGKLEPTHVGCYEDPGLTQRREEATKRSADSHVRQPASSLNSRTRLSALRFVVHAAVRGFFFARKISGFETGPNRRMMSGSEGKWHRWLPAVFLALFALSRWPGLFPPNFSAATALAFCAGVYFRGAMAWWLPLGTMLATDVALNVFYYHVAPVRLLSAAELRDLRGVDRAGPMVRTARGIFEIAARRSCWAR